MAGFNGSKFDPSRLTKASAAQYSSSDSESDDDHRRPGIGDDNDFGDFNPRKKRRIGGNNKEKAALGVFGSDSEDDGPGKDWKRKTLRKRGMEFVSSAAPQQKGSDEDDSEDGIGQRALKNRGLEPDEDDDEDEDDEDENPAAGVGLGFGGAARNMGWVAGGQQTQSNKTSDDEMEQPSMARGLGHGAFTQPFVPSSDREPKLNVPDKAGASPPRNKPSKSAFGSNGKINKQSFGARMMAKMGYKEGGGLGKEGQGRNIVIEANLRPQGAGLGAVKELNEKERQEEKRQARLRGEIVEESEDEEKKRRRRKAKQKHLGSGTTSNAGTPRRQKTKFLTVQQAQAAAPGLHIPEAFTPILDMTGPEKKMLGSASGIMTPTTGVVESEDAIETRKLVRRAQADLFAFSEEWRTLEERKTWISLELKEREQEMEELQDDFGRLQLFSILISEQLASATEWREVVRCLDEAVKLQADSPEIADIAVAAINPFLRDSGWDPLQEPSRFASDLKDMAELLMRSGKGNSSSALDKNSTLPVADDVVYRRHQKATTPYESIMYKTWLPQVLAAVRIWDPQDPGPMLAVLENWETLLPAFVRAQVMDSIARKLDTAVSDWNPRKKTRRHGQHLPHTWLFPWLRHLPPYHLDPRGTGLVADVRRKFRQMAEAWEYSRGVVPGLEAWREVLGEQWRPLVLSHVLPAMGRYLRANFRVNPADQEPGLGALTGALEWEAVVGSEAVAEVLAQHVFPMWHERLREWLALDDVNLAEVADWYAWWRGALLGGLAGRERVSAEFDKGMRLMNMV